MKKGIELEQVITRYIDDYVARNPAANMMSQALDEIGIGLFPVVDHITIRTGSIDPRAEEFLLLGYAYAETLEYDDWWAKVYRSPGCPALFVDQAYDGERGKTSIIPAWVKQFGDRTLHHIAVRVADIEASIQRLTAKGVMFAGQIVGERGGDLRQIFTVPEQVNGKAFSVLELAERHRGFQGFSPPHANSLMQSTVTR
ncbi:VOC family protein [uncultured Nitrospira sp.]|uniref:VOC family protein n=1 Tax=uncultured Nitrospira sp. TaxID=157176 RepID=UPI003140031E